MKTFNVKTNYKFGISENTKKLMSKRDKLRKSISKAKQNEKVILQQQYKKIRNKVNTNIRNENIAFNNTRIQEANDENELWKLKIKTFVKSLPL